MQNNYEINANQSTWKLLLQFLNLQVHTNPCCNEAHTINCCNSASQQKKLQRECVFFHRIISIWRYSMILFHTCIAKAHCCQFCRVFVASNSKSKTMVFASRKFLCTLFAGQIFGRFTFSLSHCAYFNILRGIRRTRNQWWQHFQSYQNIPEKWQRWQLSLYVKFTFFIALACIEFQQIQHKPI